MAFTSLTFLFLFLPIALIVRHFLPENLPKVKMAGLVLLSLLFYAWGDAAYLPVLLLSVVFNYASGRLLAGLSPDSEQRIYRRIVMITAVAVNVIMLGVFKYSGLSQPVGISFYTFTAISYLADIYREQVMPADLLTDACYMTFFPKLVSGPIVQYKDMQQQLLERPRTRADLLNGVHLFLIGLFKKVLLADNLGIAFDQIYALPQMAGTTAWLGMIFYSLQLYFDFSGYSDMAIGIARMFGYKMDANFLYPYTSHNISEFWRRWHISLGAWFREYIYIPLGGNRCSVLKQARNLAAVWILTGIWHGNTWNYVFWGVYHGCFVLLEKFVLKDRMERVPAVVRILITDLLVFLGWVFFFNPSLAASFSYLGKMFGADGIGVIDGTFFYYLRNHLVLLIVSFIGCSPLVDNLYERYVFKKGRAMTLSIVLHAVLLIFCIAGMVSSTYQTFMYFKF